MALRRLFFEIKLAALWSRTGPDDSGEFNQIQVDSSGFNQNENKKII
jgi:hypothetical protein